MRFSAAIFTSVLAAVSSVFAAPTQRRDVEVSVVSHSTQPNPAGALFFITNEPDRNRIIAVIINDDGTLILDRAVSTGGNGSRGTRNLDGPDALFSQGSVVVSASGQLLAVVNPGSNTISLFSIDPSSPTNINRIGDPISSQGEFPISLAFNNDGSRLCALNGGAVNGIACFDVDKNNGLKVISNTVHSLGLKQTTPATGPEGSASQIIFSEDETQLFVSVRGVSSEPGYVAIFDIQEDDFSISSDFSKITAPSGGAFPSSLTVIPGKNAVLASDPAVGLNVYDFAGNASSSAKIDGQNSTSRSSYSKQTGNFYLTDVGTSTITEVNIRDNLEIIIIEQYQQTRNSVTIDSDIVTIIDNDFLVVIAAETLTIEVLSLSGGSGRAAHIQSLDIAGPARAAGVTINSVNVQGLATFVTPK